MSIISIREQQKTETGFKAIVSFDGGTEYPIAVENPFPPEQEAELEWYFEQWLVFPLTQTVRAERARDSVRSYGEALFEQVFKRDVDAYSEYKTKRAALTQIEIIGDSTEFQALHWEALHDPQMPRSLAVDCVMVRKRVKATAVNATVAPAPVIRLLVVTARPGEEHDVNHRTISRPLMELIQNSQLRVQVDLLRPATFEALTTHLDEKGAGFYHIVHLDLHGAVIGFDQLAAMPHDRFTFRFGEPLEPFEGVQAFLSFESGTPGKSDLRSAAELANLLTGKQVPVCILNACQSAKQIRGDERETSLGAALMAAGMQTVLAMGYSVTVTAATLLMQTLYKQLFAGKPLDEAIRLGRKALHDRKERRAYFNQTIRLEDWLLPVVYRHGQVNLGLREFTPEEKVEFNRAKSQKFRFQQPTYGFVGRDLEILKLERSLLRRNVLLVQGMGGTGKTTLLRYLREWWQTTSFVEQSFYFGYDEKAWTLQQIVFELGKQVYQGHEQSSFLYSTPFDAQVEDLIDVLNARPFALMLDNLESVTGQQLAIQNTLNAEEQGKLRDFLQRLVGGKTKVVLGSRSREPWLESVLRGAVYELRGLDAESRTALAEQILARQIQTNGVADERKIDKMRQSEDFKKLMKLLAGYPLAMEVVLGNLRRQSAKEILAGLDAADVNLDSGSDEKTASILKCVEYSHSNLSADAQKLLVCLAPFSGFIDRTDLPRYAEQLQPLAPFQEYPFEQFDSAIQEAIDWGLLSPIDASNPHLLTIQPVFPYFLKTKLNQLDESTREALYEGFKHHYRVLAGSYNQLMNSKEPQERQTGIIFCQWEYENLYKALQRCLEKQESIDIFFCLDTYFERISDIQSGLKLAGFVVQKLESYPSELKENALADQVVVVFGQRANRYLAAQQYAQARNAFQELLAALTSAHGLDAQQKQRWIAGIHHNLGRVAQGLREFEDARRHYQQALQLLIEFNDRYSQANTYHNLGIVAQELREFEDAHRQYQQALQLFVEFNDRHSQASTYYQLGRVAEELREFEDAHRQYQEALQLFIEFNNRHSQAHSYHQLGSVAQALREFENARRYYQQALQLKIEFNDRYSQASTYHHLGSVAQALREFEEARRHYQQALQIDFEFNDRHSQALTYGQLGLLAEAEGNPADARTSLQQALDIFVEFGDEYSAAIAQQNLDRLSG